MNFNDFLDRKLAIRKQIRKSRPPALLSRYDIKSRARNIVKGVCKNKGLIHGLNYLETLNLYVTKVQKICWKPRRCIISGKFLFLRKAIFIEVEEWNDNIFIGCYGNFWVDGMTYTCELLKS
jgi:hypothetical protein